MIKEDWRLETGMYKCPHCLKEYSKKGIATHIWRNHVNNNKRWGGRKKGSTSWSKGLTKETNEILRVKAERQSIKRKQEYALGIRRIPVMSEERKRQLSMEQSLNNRGGKCKWYEVAQQKVQGTWERDLALKFEEFKIEWYKPKTNKDVFKYKLENKTKTYTPDFYLKELDLFLEVKGFWWGKDKEKMSLVLEENKDLAKQLKIVLKEQFEKIKNTKNKGELYAILAEMV